MKMYLLSYPRDVREAVTKEDVLAIYKTRTDEWLLDWLAIDVSPEDLARWRYATELFNEAQEEMRVLLQRKEHERHAVLERSVTGGNGSPGPRGGKVDEVH